MTKEAARAACELTVASIVGEGVHALLRKSCNSDGAARAYKGIADMPDEEWAMVVDVVAQQVIAALLEEGHLNMLIGSAI